MNEDLLKEILERMQSEQAEQRREFREFSVEIKREIRAFPAETAGIMATGTRAHRIECELERSKAGDADGGNISWRKIVAAIGIVLGSLFAGYQGGASTAPTQAPPAIVAPSGGS